MRIAIATEGAAGAAAIHQDAAALSAEAGRSFGALARIGAKSAELWPETPSGEPGL